MSVAAVAAPGATRARASFASASSRRRVTPPESAFSPRPGPTVRWARPLRVSTPRRRLVSTNAERPDGPEKEGDDESDADLPLGMSRNTADLLNLLVVTGGVRGSIAVVVGAAVGINALGMIHPDAQSTIHGLEWALPVLLVDALVMLPTWDLGEAAEDAIDAGDRPLGKPEKIRRALSRYQREEALSNPCRSMPAWQDALVGFTARLTDEMLDRAVVLGFIAAWVTDRAVEAGAEPFDVEDPAKYFAVVAAYAYLEFRLRRAAKRQNQTMRAFRVQRDEITGKQKMVPMDEAELNEVMDGGKKTSKDEASKSGAVEMPRGLGGMRLPSREGDSSANDDAGSSKKMPARVDEVKDEVLEVLETIGETSGAIGDDGKSGARDASSSSTASSSSSTTPTPPPMVMSPGQIGASPVGSLMFNASVKQFFDGFRSRLTLVTQSLCFVTAPGSNLWAPVLGGFACDFLFVLYQRLAMTRFFEAAEVEKPSGAPPDEALIKKTQMTLLRRDLDRRRRNLAGRVMDAVDTSEAVGAKEFNVMMREVVREVKEAEGIEKEGDALTKVLDRIHAKFTPAQLAEMEEGEAVAYMRQVLTEIREEINAEGEDANEANEANESTESKTSKTSGAAEDESIAEETPSSDETSDETSDVASADSESSEMEDEKGGEKPTLTVADLSTLAGSPDLPPPKSIWDQAREERREEMESAAAKAATEEEEKDAEPLRGVNPTWDALDSLTSAVSDKLERESKDGRD